MQRPAMSWCIVSAAIIGSFFFGLLLSSAIERQSCVAYAHIDKKSGSIGLRQRIDSWGPNHLRLYETPEVDFANAYPDDKPADALKNRPTTALMVGYEIVRANFTQGDQQTALTPDEMPPVPKEQSDLPTILPPIFKAKSPELPAVVQATVAEPAGMSIP